MFTKVGGQWMVFGGVVGIVVVLLSGLMHMGSPGSINPVQIALGGVSLLLLGGGLVIVFKGDGGIDVSSMALLSTSVVIGFVICEVIIRTMVEQDANGQSYILDRPIPPCKFDIATIEDVLAEAEFERYPPPMLIYDPNIGWTKHKDVTVHYYHINAGGIRSIRDHEASPQENVLRIALFGDSFTFGVEVDNYHMWSRLLEEELIEAGLNVEVLNFGVPGYGMDQAYLRYKYEGHNFSPDVVIFGFNPENANRNVNIVSPLYFGQLLPFTKPRFVLQEEQLELVNSPALPPETLPDLLRDFESSPLSEHEYYYVSEQYRQALWSRSKVLAFISVLFDDLNCGFTRTFPPTPLAGLDVDESLTRDIVKLFAEEVTANDADFIVLQIPIYRDVEAVQNGRSVYYDDFLHEIQEEGIPVIRVANTFVDYPVDDYFSETYHHSELGQEVLAHSAAEALLNMISTGSINNHSE